MVKGPGHFDDAGRPRMVDVAGKPETDRIAVARGAVRMAAAERATPASQKGDVESVAQLAGIMAAKRTSELIPLCHPLPLTSIAVSVEADPALPGFVVTATARTVGRTGVEMEALTAVSVACLTIYDMLKSSERAMTIDRIELVEKRGGASGDWRRGET